MIVLAIHGAPALASLPGSPYPPGPRPTPLRWGTRIGVLGVLAMPTPARATVALTFLSPCEVVLTGYSPVQHLTPRRSRPHRTLETAPSVGPVRKQNDRRSLRRRARLERTPEGAAWHSWARADRTPDERNPNLGRRLETKPRLGRCAVRPQQRSSAAALVAEPRKERKGPPLRRGLNKRTERAAMPWTCPAPPRPAPP